MKRNLLSIILLYIWIEKAFSIHFRGGTFYWAPVSKIASPTINVSITQSYSYVRTNEFCDSTTIAAQGLIGTNTTQLQCSKFYFIRKRDLKLHHVRSMGLCN
jgi:hypothetical protein